MSGLWLPAKVDRELARLPAEPGSYMLILNLAQPAQIVAGRLGEFDFPAGEYVYTGSACGPGGLRARLGRHLRGGAPHWHIDALRRAAEVLDYVYQVHDAHTAMPPLECRWLQAMLRLPGAWVPAQGFGASDCKSGCPAHLVGWSGPHA